MNIISIYTGKIRYSLSKSVSFRKIIQYQGHTSSIYSMVDIPGTEYFLSAGGDGWIVLWDKSGSDSNGILLANVEGKVFSMFYLQDTDLLVIGDISGDVYWIKLSDRTILKRVKHHKASVFDFCFDGRFLYCVSGDGFVSKWSTENMLPFESLKISNQGLRCVIFDTHTSLLMIGGSDNCIHVVNPIGMQKLRSELAVHENSVFCLTKIGADILASGSRDARFKIFRLPEFECLHTSDAHWYTINQILNIPSKHLMITASRDKSFRVWDNQSFNLLKSIDLQKSGHINSVNCMLYFDEMNVLATAGDDRSIILWDLSVDFE